jgi:pimeloyl-ACP methyl ester carboxylesterase
LGGWRAWARKTGASIAPVEALAALPCAAATAMMVFVARYMHSLTLRHLLPGAVTPTLLVWGREDAITSLECGEIYRTAIPRSRLAVIEHCGHMPEMEQPAEFARLVGDFLAG